jgi:biopolymer transport protein ExbB
MSDGLLRQVMDQLAALAKAGGFVMWPLLIVGILAWTLILLRVMTLMEVKGAHRGCGSDPKTGQSYAKKELQVRLWRMTLRRHASIIDTLVAAAPLLGLLGTVSGMIATFDGLTSMTLFSESGGIAGGISEALTTTQAGLLVAIPAFFVNRVIGRKVTKLEQRLDATLLETTPQVARCGS